jgi:signal peptidase I
MRRMVLRMRRSVSIWLLVGLLATLVATGCGKSGAGTVRHDAASTSPTALLPPSTRNLYRVTSGSMDPTIPIATRVMLKKQSPTVGAVVVFHPPEGALEEECGPTPHTIRGGGEACSQSVPKEETGNRMIRRIVAGPGDEILIREGHVYRKPSSNTAKLFERQSDSYIEPCGRSPECNFPKPIRIPAGHWFTMGDNRGESDDSRFYGPIPTTWIVGVASGLECHSFVRGHVWTRRTVQEGCPTQAP